MKGRLTPLDHDQIGIAAWWGGSRRRPGRRPAQSPAGDPGAPPPSGLLAAFVAWTALSLTWTGSVENLRPTWPASPPYLGVFAPGPLSLATHREPARGRGGWGGSRLRGDRPALRFHPAWFPAANQTAHSTSAATGNASPYPVHYWNGLAASDRGRDPARPPRSPPAPGPCFRGRWRPRHCRRDGADRLPDSLRGGIAAAVTRPGRVRGLRAESALDGSALLLASLASAVLIVAMDHRDSLPARPAGRDRPKPGQPDAGHRRGRLRCGRRPPGRCLAHAARNRRRPPPGRSIPLAMP